MVRFLVIKLADLGDVLTVTPALRALRQTFPTAQIDALVTPVGALALAGLDSVDRLISFEKARFDRWSDGLRSLGQAAKFALWLRAQRYDRVFLCHHLFTTAGRAKYRALLAAIGAPWAGGLAETCPSYLSEAARDQGYGVRHEVDYWLDVVGLVGATHPRPRLELAIPPAAHARAARLLGEAPNRRRVALYPGAGAYSPARRWSPEGFRVVGQRLITSATPDHGEGSDVEILIVGGRDEWPLAERIREGIGPPARNLAGQTDLKTLAALLAHCDLVVGNDGGVLHVAVAVGVPVVAIFGPSNHVSWGPYGAREGEEGASPGQSVVLRRDLPCSPCLYRGYLPGTPHGCRSRDCLALIHPDVVVTAARRVLGWS